MNPRFVALLALASTATAFTSSRALPPRVVTRRAATAARIVEDPLPKVYVYDHCPFCVRVRLALGVKNIKHEVCFHLSHFSTIMCRCSVPNHPKRRVLYRSTLFSSAYLTLQNAGLR